MHASKGTREETGGAASGLRTGEQRMCGSGTAQKNIPADEILVMLCADLRLPHRGCASDYCRGRSRCDQSSFPRGSVPVTVRHMRRLAWCLGRQQLCLLPMAAADTSPFQFSMWEDLPAARRPFFSGPLTRC